MSDLPVFTEADIEAAPTLEFEAFSNDDAADLGLLTVGLIRELDLNLAVKIVMHDDIVFVAKLRETGPEHDEWLDDKLGACLGFGVPSLLVRLRADAGEPFGAGPVDPDAPIIYGGAVPIRVGGQVVGAFAVSGEEDVIDHETLIEAIRRYLAS